MDQLSYAERRSQLRALQLELHPDKQEPERRTHAQLLFLLVQAKWEHCEGLTLQRPKKDADAKSKQDEAATRQEAFRRRDASWTETAETDAEAEVTSDDENSQDGEEDEEPLTLHISDLSGHLCTLQVEKRWTLWRVKVELESASGLRPEQQRLLLGSKDLDDYARLSTYSTQPSISLVLVECLERYYQRALFMKELSSSWKALQYASASLRADKELVSLAMQQNWRAWEYAAPELKNDIDLVTRVLSEDGLALQQMSRSIRANRALVLTAVKQTWRALSFASATLRRDATVVRCALVQDVAAMELAAEELKRDLNFARSAVWLQGMALKYLSPELRADRNLVHLACQKQPGALKHVAPELFEDHDFVRSLKGNSEAPKFFAWNDQQRHQMEEELFDRHNRAALEEERQLSGREREVMSERLRFAQSEDEAARDRLARALSSLRHRAHNGAVEVAEHQQRAEESIQRLQDECRQLQASQQQSEHEAGRWPVFWKEDLQSWNCG
eukprot:symbB.v1.2.000970.t1/scaffold39.1/size394969/14